MGHRARLVAIMLALRGCGEDGAAPVDGGAVNDGAAPETDFRFGLFTRFSPAFCVQDLAGGARLATASGAHVFMEALSWGAIQSGPSSWDWAQADAALAAIPPADRVLIELSDPPAWSNDNRGSWSPPMRLVMSEPQVLSATSPSRLRQTGALPFLELVTATPNPSVFHRGRDYEWGAGAGVMGILRLPGSAIPAGATVYCKYAVTATAADLHCNEPTTFSNDLALLPGWKPNLDAGLMAASLTCVSAPLYSSDACAVPDYSIRYGDPSAIGRPPGSPLSEGAAVYVSYYVLDPSPFAEFGRQAALRYRDRVTAWQIWDEPNAMWHVVGHPEIYGLLVKATAAAIRDAEPSALILAGGTGGIGIDGPFLTALLQYLGPTSSETLSFHTFGNSPESPPLFQGIGDFLASAAALGYQKPVWVTSFGWVSDPAWGTDEAAQAQYLVRAYAQILAFPQVASAVWFDLRDGHPWCGGAPRPMDPSVTYGLTRYDFTPKPSYIAYQTMATQLSGLAFVRKLDLGAPDRYGFVFAAGERRVSVLWAAGSPVTVTLPVAGTAPSRVSIDGVSAPLTAQDGHVTLAIGPSPIYLVER